MRWPVPPYSKSLTAGHAASQRAPYRFHSRECNHMQFHCLVHTGPGKHTKTTTTFHTSSTPHHYC